MRKVVHEEGGTLCLVFALVLPPFYDFELAKSAPFLSLFDSHFCLRVKRAE